MGVYLKKNTAIPKGKIKDKSRRQFMKKAGKFALVTASFSVVSMTQFHCSSSTGPDDEFNGYDDEYFGYYDGYDWDYSSWDYDYSF